MYGFFNPSNNLVPAQSTSTPTHTQQGQQQQQQQQQQQSPLATQIVFTSPPPGTAADASGSHCASYVIFNVTGTPPQLSYPFPPQQQQQRYPSPQATSDTCYATAVDSRWSGQQAYSGGLRPPANTAVNVIMQVPRGDAVRDSGEHSVLSGSYPAHGIQPPSLTLPRHDTHQAAAPATPAFAAFFNADAPPSSTAAATATTFTPFFLTNPADSRRTSFNVNVPHYVDSSAAGGINRGNNVFYQSVGNCESSQLSPSTQQQQQQQFTGPFTGQRHRVVSPPGTVSAVHASDVVSHAPSSSTSVAFSVPSARDAALDPSAGFFTPLGSAFVPPAGPHPANASTSTHTSTIGPAATTRYALPQHLVPQQAVTLQQPPVSGARSPPTFHTFLVEQPPSGVGVLPMQGMSAAPPAMAAATCTHASPPVQQQQQQQQHADPTREGEVHLLSRNPSRQASFSNAPHPQERHPVSSAWQAEKQQPQLFAAPLSPTQEQTRPAFAHDERHNSLPSGMNERSARPSLNSGIAPSRRATRISLTSLNSAALGNSMNEYHFQQQYQPEQQYSAPRLPTIQRPPPHPRFEEEEQQQQQPSHPPPRPLLLQQHSLSISQQDAAASPNLTASIVDSTSRAHATTPAGGAAAAVTSAATPVLSPETSQVIHSSPQSPSRSIARRNRDRAVLFVGQLNYEATESDVGQVFSCYGKPLSVVVLKDKGKASRRSSAAAANAAGTAGGPGGSGGPQRKVGGSAFVTYGSTLEADTAIVALHGRYNAKDDDPDNTDEAKYLQVSYGQQTGLISTFGTIHAEKLHASKPENPIPLIVLERRKAEAAAAKPS